MTHLDLDGLREMVRARYEAELPASGREIAQRITDEVIAGDFEIDEQQFVYAHVLRFVNGSARRKVDGRRVAEIVHLDDGGRRDASFEQLAIFEAEQVARRKMRHGEASIAEGRADIAVVNAATIAAARAGLSLTEATIEQVLSVGRIAELRAEAKAA